MRMLRTPEVLRITGLSRMTIHRLEKRGSFPRRRLIGSKAVAWIDTEIHDWIASRPSESVRPTHVRGQPSPAQASR
jgi:prophage regulatory protein